MAISLGSFRKAGELFGLDLEGLFAEDEDGTVEGFEGFSPTLKVTEQYQGRSPSTLTYKSPKTPPRTVTFELAPKLPSAVSEDTDTGATTDTSGEGVTEDTPQEEPMVEVPMVEVPMIEEKADRLLSSFIGPLGTAGSIGAMGVGRAQEYGYSPEEIKSKAQEEGLTFGEQAAKGLGINTNVQSYTGGAATPGAMGLAAVQRAQQAGLSDEAIRSLAQQQGLKFGKAAASALGAGAAQTYQASAPAQPKQSSAPRASSSIASFASAPSGGSIGLAGLQRAAAAKGITLGQAARRASNQGLTLGAAAQKYL